VLLVEREAAGGDDHQLGAVRVHLPRVPALIEAVLRDEPPLGPVRGVALAIGRVPFGTGELGLYRGAGGEAEVGGVGGEVGITSPNGFNHQPLLSGRRAFVRAPD
jgi:hypothetical protein